MTLRSLRPLAALIALLHLDGCAPVQPPLASPAKTSPPAAPERVPGAQVLPGYFNLHWDAKEGKLWLEIDEWGTDFLYQSALGSGVGSNDIGLDRGQLGPTRIVRFERSGPRVLLVQSNLAYRAVSEDAAERAAVRDSFAESVLWGFTVKPEADKDGKSVLVDATDFFLRDAHGVPARLLATKQGGYRLEGSRCAIDLSRTRSFPRNTEVEATLTFVGDAPGPLVQQVVPNPEAITVRERHSFIQLPPPGYRPRAHDPRAGNYGISYMDYATPVGEPVVQRLLARFRLAKKDPSAALGEAVEPIVFYVDRGAPEPIRSALVDGARWWSQAFEAAGYKDAFRVEVMPEGADPLDVRYNVIQWVHRATRGWSYGGSVIDPRTGEILKGHVTLGSLRIRQDYLIAEGLLAPHETGKPASPKLLEMALARIRQLAAHEVGHTLGFEHNFAASPSGRASVMDYPAPLAGLGPDGSIALSGAYASGIGEWDKVTVAFSYRDFPSGTDERAALEKILKDARGRGLHYLSDSDARPPGSSSSLAHLWDNGSNAIDELNRVMLVRAAALKRFGENNIPEGRPLSTLEDVLVPLYMSHRYQVEAASKLVGGMDYTFALRGDGQKPTAIVPAADQRRALAAVLATLTPAALALPEAVLNILPPRVSVESRGREQFKSRTDPAFDALAPAEAAARHTLLFLFNPQRAGRLLEFNARSSTHPGLEEVIDAVIAATWKSPRATGYAAEIARVVDDVALHGLMTLALDAGASTQVRAVAWLKLDELKSWLAKSPTKDQAERAHRAFAAARIAQLQKDPRRSDLSTPPSEPPDGPPIGMD
jgi:hypothetical protein